MKYHTIAASVTTLIIILAFMTACRHDHDPENMGIIIGYDWTECVCCGGILIEYQSDTLLFPEVPEKVHSWAENYGFPLWVLMDLQKKPSACPNFYELTSVELLSHN
jgi:hypothetical protein